MMSFNLTPTEKLRNSAARHIGQARTEQSTVPLSHSQTVEQSTASWNSQPASSTDSGLKRFLRVTQNAAAAGQGCC